MAHPKPITIVGCGPGAPEYLTHAAGRAVSAADVLVGAKRLLDLFPGQAEHIEVTAKIDDVLSAVASRLGQRSIAVLVTGDPGLFSLSKSIIARFGLDYCEVIPGISSIQVAFAKLGLEWSDAKIISAHKQDPETDGTSLQEWDKIAVLCGRKDSLLWVAKLLESGLGHDRDVFVMENLTLENERVFQIQPHDAASLEVGPSTIVLLVRKG